MAMPAFQCANARHQNSTLSLSSISKVGQDYAEHVNDNYVNSRCNRRRGQLVAILHLLSQAGLPEALKLFYEVPKSLR